MNGTFELTQLEAGKFRDADFLAAARRGTLEDLLRGLPRKAHVRRENLVFDNLAAFLFYHLMAGGDIADPYDSGGSANAALSFMALLTYSSEPTYQEASNEYGNQNMYQIAGIAGSGAKRFIEEVIESTVIRVDPGGREAIECRSRWLFLPSEGVSDDIRSIGVYFASDGDSTGTYISRARIARVRLKDAAGREIIINKTSSQVLLIEYTLRLVSV